MPSPSLPNAWKAAVRHCYEALCGIHTRVSTLLTTQSRSSKLLECINNANKLCLPGSQPRGIILLGDSAGAHFHISPEWITASQMSLVSNFGSNYPGCATLCVWSLLAPSKCDANSKQVQISLLSKICCKKAQPQPFQLGLFQTMW